MKDEHGRKVTTRVSEDDLGPQLQLARVVRGTVVDGCVHFAKGGRIRNVVVWHSKNDSIKYVESFRSKLDAPTFSLERELAED